VSQGHERHEYEGVALDPSGVDPDPIAQFGDWFAQAREAGVYEPEAMTLSTVDEEGRPVARTVLLRGMDKRGFQFFTNYDSAKGRQLARRPAAALTFAWLPVHRQVRVEGSVERLPAAESDAYFAGRPRLARLGAWASPQSAVLESRAALDARMAQVQERFAGAEDVPRPEHWGGFVVRPRRVELWQGRRGRLHDRVRYERDAGAWRIERLAP
jgi:pyridoxamine 5'-phosphate oxidase